MRDLDEVIKECFSKLKLDDRASQREVEIAFDVLARGDIDPKLYQEYRFAFEFLMQKYFCVNGEENAKTKEDADQEIYEDIISVIPSGVRESLNNIEGETGSLTDKAKAIFSTQIINLPMFMDNIMRYSTNIFGFKFWTKKKMMRVLKESCLNPLVYNDLTFELTFNGITDMNKIWDLRDFVESLKKTNCSDKMLCRKFKCKNTIFGVVGHVIAEHSIIERLEMMLKNKSEQCDCFLNATVSEEGSV